MSQTMTGDDLKRIRKAAGLSLNQMAEFCQLTSSTNLRQMEDGKKPVSGPIAVIATAIDRGYLAEWLDETFPE